MQDLIIIGAGPGGSTAAYYAARSGLSVLLLDQSEFPRDKTCGDGLTPRAVHELEKLGIRGALEQQAQRIHRVQVVSPSGHRTDVEIPEGGPFPDHAWVLQRKILDDAIRRQALRAGADFAAPVRATAIENLGDQVRVRARTGRGEIAYRASMVVIATGAAMPLLKRTGLLGETPDVIRAVRGYFAVEHNPGSTWAFRFDDVPLPGYGWIFPVADHVANIGLGYWPGGRKRGRVATGESLKRFLASSGIEETLGRVRPLEKPRGYPLRTDFKTARTFGDRILVVGEAAGLVNPMTGEGIDYALASGRLAAEFLSENGLDADLAGYDALLRQHFQGLFSFSDRVRRLCMSRFCLDSLTRWANRREDLKLLLTNILLGTVSVPQKIPIWKGLRTLLGV